jgi:hypothetical protein
MNADIAKKEVPPADVHEPGRFHGGFEFLPVFELGRALGKVGVCFLLP